VTQISVRRWVEGREWVRFVSGGRLGRRETQNSRITRRISDASRRRNRLRHLETGDAKSRIIRRTSEASRRRNRLRHPGAGDAKFRIIRLDSRANIAGETACATSGVTQNFGSNRHRIAGETACATGKRVTQNSGSPARASSQFVTVMQITEGSSFSYEVFK